MKPTYEELQSQVEVLRQALRDQLNDCINFDGGKLTDCIMENSTTVLQATPATCLAQIKAEAVNEFANEICGNCASGFQVQLSGEADKYVKRMLKGGKE
jgi:hypothetical protein